MKLTAVYLLLFSLFISLSSIGQKQKLSIAKKPEWATVSNINYNKSNLDNEAQDGYVDYAFEKQVSLAQQTIFYRTILKITTQAGVQNASQINISFDPSYEKLVFHEIKILRNGSAINKLNLSKIEVARQESNLDDFIYNGSMNAFTILDDVRQGDFIEYSYSRVGFNPVFENKYTDIFSLQIDYPVYEYYYKLIVPNSRKINYRVSNDNINATVSAQGESKIYEWKKSDVRPMNLQDMVPAWYNPYPRVEISEFNNWNEVNKWSMGLFPFSSKPAGALLKKIGEIKANNSSDDKRTIAALRFVQDDIRYMGIEMGVNSHRPANPEKVFNQRFGDCKEKSYLLCTMLREMGIHATPVLINSSETKGLFSLLPSPTVFDHVVVKVVVNGRDYWFDPTISFQRGGINAISFPNYSAGLVLSDTTTSLSTIPVKAISKVETVEYFTIKPDFKNADLKVTTTYWGDDADAIRGDFNNLSKVELMEKYQKYYATYFQNIVADSINFVENEENGTIETIEYYHINKIWKTNTENGLKISIYPFVTESIIRRPKDRERTMPVSLYFPAEYKEKIIFDMPEAWNVDEDANEIKSRFFTYSNRFYSEANKVILETSYSSLTDFAPVSECAEYFDKIEEYDNASTYEVTYGSKQEKAKSKTDKSKGFNTSGAIKFLAIIAALAAGIFFARRQQRRHY